MFLLKFVKDSNKSINEQLLRQKRSNKKCKEPILIRCITHSTIFFIYATIKM
jgi:hypothetical protein